MEQSTVRTEELTLTHDTPEEDVMPRDTRVEQLLQSWNLQYELDEAYPLLRLKIEDATQIREASHRAPKAAVDQYVTHMRHGAIFPPIVVGTNGMLVDGNTRVEASRVLNRKTFPAYKVKFPHLGLARIIAAALNQMGGERLTEDEIITAAEAMMAEGHPDDYIARTLGRSISHVYNVRKDRKLRETLERLNLTDVRLPKATARVLAGIQHDEPFKAAVALVQRANPSAKEVGTLVKGIEDTRSDAEALALIDATETQWGPVTGPPPHSAKKPLSRSKAKRALTHVRAILALGDARDFVLPENGEASKAWRELNALSSMVVALYPAPSEPPTEAS